MRCCAKMMFDYFGEDISKKEIWKELHVYKRKSGLWGGYFQDLGKIAIARGYEAIIYHYDWKWWNKETVDASKGDSKNLVKALQRLRKQKKGGEKKEIDKDIDFTHHGGKFQIELPKLSAIDSYLHKKIPVILMVRSEDLYHDPEDVYNHVIVVVGKQGNNYFIRDPYLAVQKISADELLYAWTRATGWMMVIYK